MQSRLSTWCNICLNSTKASRELPCSSAVPDRGESMQGYAYSLPPALPTFSEEDVSAQSRKCSLRLLWIVQRAKQSPAGPGSEEWTEVAQSHLSHCLPDALQLCRGWNRFGRETILKHSLGLILWLLTSWCTVCDLVNKEIQSTLLVFVCSLAKLSAARHFMLHWY